MIHLSIKNIVAGLSHAFPINLFLVSHSGKIRWANDAMLKASGVSNLKEIKGKHASIFGEQEWLITQKVIESNQEAILYETHQDKNFIVIKTPYSKKGFRGVLGFSMDITKLEQAKQAKQEFMLNMSHDLRTPFTGVYSCAELLYEEAKDEKTKEYLGYIITSSKQWMEVVDNIFDIYKADTIDYKVSSFNIRSLLLEIHDLYSAVTYTKGLQFFILCENFSVKTQYLRLKQILISLVSNAIKFTEQGYIEIKAFATEQLLILQVKDTGIGIPEDKQAYIFERFTKLNPSGKSSLFVGTGLGLYIAKQCIDQLKGKITLSSQPGKFSLFQIEIPLNVDKKEEVNASNVLENLSISLTA